MAQTTPQQRSNLARKAAQIRWSSADIVHAVNTPSSSSHCEADSTEAIFSYQPQKVKRRARTAKHSWLDERFCLRLYQNPAGEWRLRTPAGLDLPATNFEISLWLDIESLRFQLSND